MAIASELPDVDPPGVDSEFEDSEFEPLLLLELASEVLPVVPAVESRLAVGPAASEQAASASGYSETKVARNRFFIGGKPRRQVGRARRSGVKDTNAP